MYVRSTSREIGGVFGVPLSIGKCMSGLRIFTVGLFDVIARLCLVVGA